MTLSRILAVCSTLSSLIVGTQCVQAASPNIPSRCVAFSPYVGSNDPGSGPHPTPAQIDVLLDRLVATTNFRCILTYGVLNGLDYTFQSAAARGIKVIAILWLDTDSSVNQMSITKGIESAQAYPNTIIAISCGSEFRTRHGTAMDSIILNCISQLRTAGVTQPITTIDTWWEWCNRSITCATWSMVNNVDWIGINIFPWWENVFSGIYTCTRVDQAASFHISRLQEVRTRYPSKTVIITEFGWPAGPAGLTRANQYTGQHCVGGEAGEINQRRVIVETLGKLDSLDLRGIVFESFRQGNWKLQLEGAVGPFWGICQGVSPFSCKQLREKRTDFDGDGKSDVGVYKNGAWSILGSSSGPISAGWGGSAWTPVPGDYDGDGKADIAVYSNGNWSIIRSFDGGNTVFGWGGPAWMPVPADYDGDGKVDIAVYQVGAWSIVRSSDSGNTTFGWGGPAWTVVPGDYDGDGRADIAVYNANGTWSIVRSSDGGNTVVAHGGTGWVPVAADFDGDGKTDIAVYNTGTGQWSIRRSSDNGNTIANLGGAPEDIPLR